jgi:hypothetical protein
MPHAPARLADARGPAFIPRMKLAAAALAFCVLLSPGFAASSAKGKATAPAASGKKSPGKGDQAEEPKIEGMPIERAGGKGFLGVLIDGGKFKLGFYDAEKKPVAPDVASAALRWEPRGKIGRERVLLTPGAENTLTAERTIQAPYNFRLTITLLRENSTGGPDATGENYVIDFRQ